MVSLRAEERRLTCWKPKCRSVACVVSAAHATPDLNAIAQAGLARETPFHPPGPYCSGGAPRAQVLFDRVPMPCTEAVHHVVHARP